MSISPLPKPIVRALLSAGWAPYWESPIHWAAWRGKVTVVQLLLAAGVCPDQRDDVGDTALHKAAYGGHVHIARLLLEAGADLSAVNEDGFTPLRYAAETLEADGLRGARVLHASGGALDLFSAALLGEVDTVERILLLRDSINEYEGAGEADYEPIHAAAFGGHTRIIRLLLNDEWSVDEEGSQYETPLICAARAGHYEAVQHLLDAGADVQASGGPYGYTALHWAAAHGHLKLVRLLLQHGASVGATEDVNSDTPLDFAVQYDHREVVRELRDTCGLPRTIIVPRYILWARQITGLCCRLHYPPNQ